MVFSEEENASTEVKADRMETHGLPYIMHTENLHNRVDSVTDYTSERIFQNYGKVIKYSMLKSNFGLARKTIIKYF
jgi:predicted nucleic acid-binding protein